MGLADSGPEVGVRVSQAPRPAPLGDPLLPGPGSSPHLRAGPDRPVAPRVPRPARLQTHAQNRARARHARSSPGGAVALRAAGAVLCKPMAV